MCELLGNSALLDLDSKELSYRFLCHHHFDKKYFLGRGLALTAVPDPCPIQNVRFSVEIFKCYRQILQVSVNPTSEFRAECAECSEQFYTFAQMFRHINVIHNWTKYFKCKLCKKIFFSRLLLKEHLSTHEPQHICKICGKKFLFFRFLATHTRNHGPFTCVVWNTVWSFIQKKQNHLFSNNVYRYLDINLVRNVSAGILNSS